MAESLPHEPAIRVHRFTGHHGALPHGPVSHVGCAIGLIERGWTEMEVGHRIRGEAGSLMILPAGTPHRLLAQSDNYASVAVGFCPTCLALDESAPLMAAVRRVRLGAVPVVPLDADRQARVATLIDQLATELERSDSTSPDLATALLHLLLGEAGRAMPAPDTDAPPPTLAARALTWIQAHALSPVSLSDAAAAVHCTPSHLATVVKGETGHTVGQWLVSIRVCAAADWLLHSDASMDEIAVKVGWRDTTHFIRQFKKQTGETPAAWRRARR